MAWILNVSTSASEPLFITLALTIAFYWPLRPKHTGLLFIFKRSLTYLYLFNITYAWNPPAFLLVWGVPIWVRKLLCLPVIVISNAGESVGKKAFLHSSWGPKFVWPLLVDSIWQSIKNVALSVWLGWWECCPVYQRASA